MPQVQSVIAGLVSQGAAATRMTTDLEAGYSGRDRREVDRIVDRRRSEYVPLAINETIAERARAIKRRMAARGHHRAAGFIDLLTAAVAEHYGAVLLHCVADFEHIAAATGQAHAWVVPGGSIG